MKYMYTINSEKIYELRRVYIFYNYYVGAEHAGNDIRVSINVVYYLRIKTEC